MDDATVHLVGQDGHVERGADLAHLLFRFGRFNKQDVFAGVRVGLPASQCLVEAQRRQRVGARQDQEVRRRARV